jgi:hypothetical protein
MSKFLQDALRASLESDVMQEGAIDASADINEAIEQTLEATASSADDTGPTVADMKDQIESTDNVASVLETIGDAALSTPETTEQPLADGQIENPAPNGEVVTSTGVAVPPSMESLAFALQSVLASHGVALRGPAMESGEGQGEAIARVAHTTAANLRSNLEVSLEDTTKFAIGYLEARAKLVNQTKSALTQAIQKCNGKKAELDESPAVVNQKGIFQFMHRDGEFVEDLAGAFSTDMKVLQQLHDIIVKGAGLYDHLKTGDTSEGAVEKFLAGLADINLGKELDKFDGAKLLGDKTVSVIPADKNDGWGIVEVNVTSGGSKSDGSKVGLAGAAHIVKSIGKGATHGMVHLGAQYLIIGTGVGAALGGNAAGVAGAVGGGAGLGIVMGTAGAIAGTVGGLVGGAIGGAITAKGSQQGKETNVPVKLADLISFLKDAEKMCDLAKDIPAAMNKVNAADKEARVYARTIGADTSEGFLDKALTKVGMYKSDGRRMVSTSENGKRVMEVMNGNYYTWLAASELLIIHLLDCVNTALKIAQVVVKA